MKRPILLVIAIYLASLMMASNTLSFSSVSGTPQTEVEVMVSLENTDAIVALEMVLPLGEHLTYIDNSAVLAEARSNGHQISAGQVGQELRVYIYSLSLNALQGNMGELMTFRLQLGNEPIDFTLSPTLILSNAQGKSVNSSVQTGNVTIQAPKLEILNPQIDFGHIPIRDTYTQDLLLKNVGTMPLSIENISTTNPLLIPLQNAMTIEANQTASVAIQYAPVKHGAISEKINVRSDAPKGNQEVIVVADPFSVNELHMSNASGTANEEVIISLSMNNMAPIVAVQCSIALPEQLEYVPNSIVVNSLRSNGHQALATIKKYVPKPDQWYEVTSDTLVLMLFSMNNQAFDANDGEIASFKLRLNGSSGDYAIRPHDAALLTASTENLISAAYEGTVSIQSPSFNGDDYLSFGDWAITDNVVANYIIRNYGPAPLQIERVSFLAEGFHVASPMPLQLAQWEESILQVAYTPKGEGDFATTMNIYTNDPTNRMKAVAVSGHVYEPNTLSVDCERMQDGSYQLAISLDNYTNIVGVQYDIHWRSDMTTSQAAFMPTARLQNHNATVVQMDEDTYRVLIYSMANAPIIDNEGEVHRLTFTPQGYVDYCGDVLTIDNIVLSNANGTDKASQSTVLYHLPTTQYSEETITVCDEYVYNDKVYQSSGTYIDTLQTVDGCDSIVTLHLTVNKRDTIHLYRTACEEYYWDSNGETYYESGDYEYHTNTSVTTKKIYVGYDAPNDAIIGLIPPRGISKFTVDGFITQGNGSCFVGTGSPENGIVDDEGDLRIFDAGCFYYDRMSGRHDCFFDDFRDPFNIEFGNYYARSLETGEYYFNDGENMYEYSNTEYPLTLFYNDYGKIHKVQFFDNNNLLWADFNAVIEGEVPMIKIDYYETDGTIYHTQKVIENLSAETRIKTVCGPVEVLHLTINRSDTAYFSAAACDSYEWHGVTYTTSGTYEHLTQTVHGCDSIEILNLTILGYEPYRLTLDGESRPDSTYLVSIGLENYDDVEGVQYDLHWRGDMTTSQAAFKPSARMLNHNYNVIPLDEDSYRIKINPLSNTKLLGNTGELNQLVFSLLNSCSIGVLDCENAKIPINYVVDASKDIKVVFKMTVESCENETGFGNAGAGAGGMSSWFNADRQTFNILCGDVVDDFAFDYTYGDAIEVTMTNGYYEFKNSQGGYKKIEFEPQNLYCSNSFVFCDNPCNWKGSVYYVKIYEDGQLVRSYLPQPDGTLKDFISGTIAYPAYGTITYREELIDITPIDKEQCYSTITIDNIVLSNANGTNKSSAKDVLLVAELMKWGEETITACDEYVWNGTTYTETGIYIDTIPSQAGCDSIVTLHLTINRSITTEETEVVCDSYTWTDGKTYTESGTYYQYLQTIHGCDSTVVLNLTVNRSIEVPYEVTTCDSYTWSNGVTYMQSGIYYDSLQTIHGCDSVEILTLTINYSDTAYFSVTACDSYVWHDETYTTSGTYEYLTQTVNGCDSLEVLTLTINRSITTEQTEVVCDSYIWTDGKTYTESGTYYQYLQTIHGCDSTVVLHLTVNRSIEVPYEVTACDSYTWSNGITYTQSGVYYDSLKTIHGCDSVEILTLTINYSDTAYFSVTACDSYVWHDETYTTSGTYEYLTQTINGCDSLEVLTLTINRSITTEQTEVVCDSYIWTDGKTYTESGTYYQYLQTIHGCDSTVVLHLTVNRSIEVPYEVTACDSYTWSNGVTYTQSGVYYDSLKTIHGCDSVEILRLTINYSDTVYFSATACDSYVWHDETYTTSGTYEYLTQTVNGCDSLEVLTLTINRSITTEETEVACDSYTWTDGKTYTESGTYYQYLQIIHGCDSTVVLHLTVNRSIEVPYEVTACDSYTWSNGVTYTQSGVYYDSLQTIHGCDSVEILTLTINYSDTAYFSVTACDSYVWHDETYTTSGTYEYLTQTVHGCDSLEVLTLTINRSITTEQTEVACDSYTWIDGKTYTESGTYYQYLQTIHGCDSTVVLHLTVNRSVEVPYEVIACDSYTWSNGITYTQSGVYYDSLKTIHGCDSVEILTLTINYSDTAYFSVTACDSYVWHDETYTTSGTYEYLTQTIHGCDSLEVLTLTINRSITTEQTEVACDSYTWTDGKTYTESGTYYQYLQTIHGCDSTVVLHLTVNRSIEVPYEVTACDSYTWSNGVTYTQSGVYYDSLQTIHGCDSVEILTLTINYSDTAYFSATACDSYVWHDETYTTSGTYEYLTQTVHGCDSLEVLTLTVNRSVTSEETYVSCDSYTWNGETYSESGEYVYTTVAANGCDSIVTLHLTILPDATTESETLALCPSELPYEWHGQSITEAGTYSAAEPYAGMECDSVIHELTLNVYVQTLPAAVTLPIVRTGDAIDVTIPTAEIQAHIAAETWYAPNALVEWYIMENSDWAALTDEPVAVGIEEVTLKYAVETDCGIAESDKMVIAVETTGLENIPTDVMGVYKVLRDNKIFIIRGGKAYSIMGHLVGDKSVIDPAVTIQ